MLAFALQLHVLHHNVMDFTQRRAVFQHLPRFVRVEVNLNQFIVPHCQQTVALEMLRDVVGFDTLKSKVVNPLTGKKIGAYYGCLLLRPGKVLQMDDPENPKIMEDFIRALGAEPVIYPMRNECCGGYVSIEDKAAAESRRNIVAASAAGFEAEMMITACPLCMYNLKKNDSNVPVYYFTELLAEALGVKD